MRNYPFLLFLIFLAAALMLACGGSSFHIPQSVSISPATANAKDFSGSQVQFTATVNYSTMPSPVRNVSASWSACFQNVPSDGVSVSANGVAQCASGTTGTYTVYAFVADPSFHGACASGSSPCGGACGGVVGSAQLDCP